jgi:hypothetical protein
MRKGDTSAIIFYLTQLEHRISKTPSGPAAYASARGC